MKAKVKSTERQRPGNSTTFFSPATIQPKPASPSGRLTIGQPNDKCEQEANAMASKVMRMPHNTPGIQAKCTSCEEEETLQTKPLMMKSEGGGGVATSALSSQLNSSKGGGSPLPDSTNQFMSNAFGNDFSNVRVHTGSRAVQMNQGLNASAFTHGSDVYFNQGEYSPESSGGKRLLGHELTHVVQQGNTNQRSPAIQREVSWGNAGLGALIGGAVGAGIGAFGGVGGALIGGGIGALLGGLIGLFSGNAETLATWGGIWKAKKYKEEKDGTGKEIGVDMNLEFMPNENVNAKKIGLVQTVNSTMGGAPIALNPTIAARSIPVGETDSGFHIDQHQQYKNPLYATGASNATDTLATTATNNKEWGRHGWRYKQGRKWKKRKAILKDTPKLSGRGANASQIFETTALAIDGNQKGMYYGSVQWGWQSDASGKFEKLPFKVISQGTPSARFIRSAELWNTNPTSTPGVSTLNLPLPGNIVITNVLQTDFLGTAGGKKLISLVQGTRLEDTGTRSGDYAEVKIVDGVAYQNFIGKKGWVKTTQFNDERP